MDLLLLGTGGVTQDVGSAEIGACMDIDDPWCIRGQRACLVEDEGVDVPKGLERSAILDENITAQRDVQEIEHVQGSCHIERVIERAPGNRQASTGPEEERGCRADQKEWQRQTVGCVCATKLEVIGVAGHLVQDLHALIGKRLPAGPLHSNPDPTLEQHGGRQDGIVLLPFHRLRFAR
jgi:hypothetical protein